ncbi:carbohydrate ABC transporter permease [Acidisphaera sp. L21]|uniref:carbohydrate ABC transporter permease n=1 Tax=Acidisphaera sp. L21 TaxID=1641851 RepID=UPI00131E369A|nr:sugar ABC transporter permease [Acidisphaera sp. L21]
MSAHVATIAPAKPATAHQRRRNYARRYRLFIVPAGIVVAAVIVFPWLFTLFMSVQDFHVGGAMTFVGLANYTRMLSDERFLWAILHTLYFTVLAVIFPTILGVIAAVCFNQRFPLRGLARTIFILPMMATPVAVALVWTMMFHPQLGVLNYLLTSIGLPPSTWVYDSATVIPTLVMVETWQWTPLIMLIVLGGLASLPQDPYEAAALDGASAWQCFIKITLPLVWPFIMVALVLRAVDALKAFDTIFVISGGGPGTSSETLNLYLYQEAFAYYDIGYASAIVVVFFVLILLVTLLLMSRRAKAAAA